MRIPCSTKTTSQRSSRASPTSAACEQLLSEVWTPSQPQHCVSGHQHLSCQQISIEKKQSHFHSGFKWHLVFSLKFHWKQISSECYRHGYMENVKKVKRCWHVQAGMLHEALQTVTTEHAAALDSACMLYIFIFCSCIIVLIYNTNHFLLLFFLFFSKVESF